MPAAPAPATAASTARGAPPRAGGTRSGDGLAGVRARFRRCCTRAGCLVVLNRDLTPSNLTPSNLTPSILASSRLLTIVDRPGQSRPGQLGIGQSGSGKRGLGNWGSGNWGRDKRGLGNWGRIPIQDSSFAEARATQTKSGSDLNCPRVQTQVPAPATTKLHPQKLARRLHPLRRRARRGQSPISAVLHARRMPRRPESGSDPVEPATLRPAARANQAAPAGPPLQPVKCWGQSKIATQFLV